MWRKTRLGGMSTIQNFWQTVWTLLQKRRIELSYDPSIPLIGIYPMMYTHKHILITIKHYLTLRAKITQFAVTWVDVESTKMSGENHCWVLKSINSCIWVGDITQAEQKLWFKHCTTPGYLWSNMPNTEHSAGGSP